MWSIVFYLFRQINCSPLSIVSPSLNARSECIDISSYKRKKSNSLPFLIDSIRCSLSNFIFTARVYQMYCIFDALKAQKNTTKRKDAFSCEVHCYLQPFSSSSTSFCFQLVDIILLVILSFLCIRFLCIA